MKAIVNDNCGGSGSCIQICPEVFELGDGDKASVKKDPIPKENEEACLQAERECPFHAIKVQE